MVTSHQLRRPRRPPEPRGQASTQGKITLGLWNSRGRSNLHDALPQLLGAEQVEAETHFDILGVTETAGSELNHPNYQAYHLAGQNRLGSGLSLYVHRTIRSRCTAVRNMGSETLCIETDSLRVILTYISPSLNMEEFDRRLEELGNLADGHHTPVLIGDFNATTTSRSERLNRFLTEQSLCCDNDGLPTHVDGGVLDLVITPWELRVTVETTTLDFQSDHRLVIGTIETNVTRQRDRRRQRWRSTRRWRPEQWDSMALTLARNVPRLPNVPWDQDAADQAFNLCRDWIHHAMELHIGKTTTTNKFQAPWWSNELKAVIDQKRYLGYLYRYNPSEENRSIYLDAKREVRRKIRRAKRAAWAKRIEEVATAPVNQMWRLVKRLRGSSKGAPNSLIVDGIHLSNVAATFADHLSNVGNDQTLEPDKQQDVEQEICRRENSRVPRNDLTIGIEETRRAFERLKNSLRKSPGPDGITNIVLYKCRQILCLTIHQLFEGLVQSSLLPRDWMRGTVIMIRKSQKIPSTDINNYRPITLLSTIRKLYESILCNRLQDVIEYHGILNKNQFGFRRGHGTSHNLLALRERIDEWWRQMKRGERRRGILVFMDARKAFDRASRQVTYLSLLRDERIPLCLVRAIRPFLMQNSIRQVRCKDTISQEYSITTGVAQGAILSPILFNMFLNPVMNAAMHGCIDTIGPRKMNVLGYADDLMILEPTPERAVSTLTRVANAAKQIGLEFNTEKTLWMSKAHQNAVIKLNGVPLRRVTAAKYLGVEIQQQNRGRHFVIGHSPLLGAFNGRARTFLRFKGLSPRRTAHLLTTCCRPLLDVAATALSLKSWESFDRRVRSEIRRAVGIPKNLATAIVEDDLCLTATTLRFAQRRANLLAMESSRGSWFAARARVARRRLLQPGIATLGGVFQETVQVLEKAGIPVQVTLDRTIDLKTKRRLINRVVDDEIQKRWRRQYRLLTTHDLYRREAEKRNARDPLARNYTRLINGRWIMMARGNNLGLYGMRYRRHQQVDPRCVRCPHPQPLETLQHLLLAHADGNEMEGKHLAANLHRLNGREADIDWLSRAATLISHTVHTRHAYIAQMADRQEAEQQPNNI